MTDEDRTQPRPRESLLWPVVIPLGLLALIGLVLWGFSRVLLHVRPNVATATALLMAIAIVAIVAIAASRPRVGNGALLSVGVGVLGVGMLASGAALLFGAVTEEAPMATIAVAAPEGATTDGFQPETLTAPADEPFTIEFDNQDTGVQHNVVVTSDDPTEDPGATTFLSGTPIVGPAQVADPVPALPEGEYFFYCEFHPTTMTGALTAAPGAGGEGGPPQLSTAISASGLAFDTSTLTFAAAEATPLEFNNNDTAPHDLAILPDSSATDPLFDGDIVDPATSTTYQIPALDPGSYFFRCTIHPEMSGTVNVVEAPSGGGDGKQPPGGEPPPSGSASPSAPG